jgi:hypothetical protein
MSRPLPPPIRFRVGTRPPGSDEERAAQLFAQAPSPPRLSTQAQSRHLAALAGQRWGRRRLPGWLSVLLLFAAPGGLAFAATHGALPWVAERLEELVAWVAPPEPEMDAAPRWRPKAARQPPQEDAARWEAVRQAVRTDLGWTAVELNLQGLRPLAELESLALRQPGLVDPTPLERVMILLEAPAPLELAAVAFDPAVPARLPQERGTFPIAPDEGLPASGAARGGGDEALEWPPEWSLELDLHSLPDPPPARRRRRASSDARAVAVVAPPSAPSAQAQAEADGLEGTGPDAAPADPWAEARGGLEGLAQAGRTSEAELDLLWGEHLMKEERWRDAVKRFTRVLALSPAGELAERALYGRAISFAHLGDAIASHADADLYISRFPKGRYANVLGGRHRH